MFKSILVPIDIAHRSTWEGALPRAVELARASGGKMTVITAVRDVKAMLEGVRFPFQVEIMMSGARDKLIGPNASHVAQHAECSLLVLRRMDERWS